MKLHKLLSDPCKSAAAGGQREDQSVRVPATQQGRFGDKLLSGFNGLHFHGKGKGDFSVQEVVMEEGTPSACLLTQQEQVLHPRRAGCPSSGTCPGTSLSLTEACAPPPPSCPWPPSCVQQGSQRPAAVPALHKTQGPCFVSKFLTHSTPNRGLCHTLPGAVDRTGSKAHPVSAHKALLSCLGANQKSQESKTEKASQSKSQDRKRASGKAIKERHRVGEQE
jgi:hypothetical protein